MIDVALIGCGHMGTHHARTVAAHPGCRLVATVDVVPQRARALAERHGARAMGVVPAEVDAVIVATPTTSHARVADGPLSRGQWCLVEKPVAVDLEDLASLDGERLVVGHSERFNPAVRCIPRPLGGQVDAVRWVPPTGRGRDVDVVLDLMIHDLDLLLWWAGDTEAEVLAQAGGAEEARVELRVGAFTARLHASRRAERGARQILLRGAEGPQTLDLLRGRVTCGDQPIPPLDDQDALTCQWEAFVDAVNGGPRAVTLEDGAMALRLALKIRQELHRSAA